MKRIRRKSLDILCDWMHTLIPDEEKSKITPSNVETYLSQQDYIYKNKTIYLSIYTRRWVVSMLKKMVRNGVDLTSINYTTFNTTYRPYIHGTS